MCSLAAADAQCTSLQLAVQTWLPLLRALPPSCRAADGVKQRCGTTVTPVFISLDPSRNKPDDLRRVASAAGGVVALTGDADGASWGAAVIALPLHAQQPPCCPAMHCRRCPDPAPSCLCNSPWHFP